MGLLVWVACGLYWLFDFTWLVVGWCFRLVGIWLVVDAVCFLVVDCLFGCYWWVDWFASVGFVLRGFVRVSVDVFGCFRLVVWVGCWLVLAAAC